MLVPKDPSRPGSVTLGLPMDCDQFVAVTQAAADAGFGFEYEREEPDG